MVRNLTRTTLLLVIYFFIVVVNRSSAAENTRGILLFSLSHHRVSSCCSFSETCIKGHRSSSCKHTDRPLFEIKKKGRPVTQCEHCRELRKTKQVHVKCICESRTEPSSKQGVLTSALFRLPSRLAHG